MHKKYELYRNGVLVEFSFVDLDVGDTVQMKIHRELKNDKGEFIVNSTHEHYFTQRQFREFFTPIVNDLKERFDNESNKQHS